MDSVPGPGTNRMGKEGGIPESVDVGTGRLSCPESRLGMGLWITAGLIHTANELSTM